MKHTKRDAWDISAGGPREFNQKLSKYYNVNKIRYQGDFDDGDGNYYSEVLLYWDGDNLHIISDDVPVYSHGQSGAVGCYYDDLPDCGSVRTAIREIEGVNNFDEEQE